MATINLSLSTKVDATGKSEILIRFTHGGGTINQRGKSNIFIPAEQWDKDNQKIIIPNPRVLTPENRELKQYLTEQSGKLTKLTSVIQTAFIDTNKQAIAADWLKSIIDKHINPEKYEPKEETQSFFETFLFFLETLNIGKARKTHYLVLFRALQRYELYKRKSLNGKLYFALNLDNVTPETLKDLKEFLKNEFEIKNEYPEIYAKCKHEQKPRGKNTINGMLSKLRTFFIWAVRNKNTINNPFENFDIEGGKYGTPYYITIDERNHLYNTDLSHRPALEVQRDIFIFQCLIGCRIADLYKLTKQNIINGAIEYIARKTKDGRPVTVRVPLNSIAKKLLQKYTDFEGKTLLPYISEQRYNDAIKEVFTAANITRPVVTLDTITRENVIRPINKIASSHLARRCFVGNLYKKVKDANLVGSLSGHTEGSRAFARYYAIDEDLKNELVKMLE